MDKPTKFGVTLLAILLGYAQKLYEQADGWMDKWMERWAEEQTSLYPRHPQLNWPVKVVPQVGKSKDYGLNLI